MTLTLTLEALCSRNVFVFKEYLIMLIAIKYNEISQQIVNKLHKI